MRLLLTCCAFSFMASLPLWSPVHAQVTKQVGSAKTLSFQNLSNDSILAAFSLRFAALDSLVNNLEATDAPLVFTHSLFTDVLDSVYEDKRMHARKAFKRKSGLELTGQTYYRLDDQFGFDEQDDQYSKYKAKFQGEVGWNFFNSSFLQRKLALQLIDLDNRIGLLRQKEEYAGRMWDDAESDIERKYNAWTVAVLREQLRNIHVLNMAYQFTLESDRSSNEKLLDTMNEQMRLEHAIAQADDEENKADISRLEQVIPVAVEVDSLMLFGYVLDHNTEIKVSHIQEEMLGTKRKLTNYAHEMRFTPFFRASHYLRDGGPSSTNTEVGVRFTFPLYSDTPEKRRSMRAEQNLIALTRQHLSEDLLGQCRQRLSQLIRLNVAITAERRHTLRLHRFINLRKEAYLNSLNGYNHIARLEEYNEYLKSMERTYNLLRLRQLCLLDIQKTTGCMDLTPMIKIKEITE